MPHPSRAAGTFRAGAALLAALALALLHPLPALAHTKLGSSRPAAGDTVEALAEVRLGFTRPVSDDLTTLALILGADTVAAGKLAMVPGSEGKEYVYALARPLAPGAYTVAWRTAGADGHVIQGSFAFVVAGAAARADSARAGSAARDSASGDTSAAGPVGVVSPPDEPSDTGETDSPAGAPLAVLVRWGWFLSLLGMIGAAAFRLVVLGKLAKDPAHAAVAERAAYGTWLLALAAAALSVLTLLARLWQQASALNDGDAFTGTSLNVLLTRTGWGTAWVLQALATVAFFVGLMVARSRHGRGVGWLGAAAAAVLLSAVPALSGHAASVEELTGVAILSDTLHVLGAGAWLGTLSMLLAAGLPATLAAPEGEGAAAVAAMVNRFSPMALAASGVAAVTGIVNSLFHVGSFGALFGTGYGRFLILKLALLAGVAALGWYNWRRVRPALGADEGTARLRRSARLEIATGLAVVLVTAVLVALPTP
jgi:putative copper export protein/methionine-rich copper-binding protein CopC